jgi:hypothetical protein
MLDKRGIDRAQLIVYVQIALNASVKIFELHLKTMVVSYGRPWDRLWVDTYRYSRLGNLQEDLEARPLENTAHFAEGIVR